MLVDFFKLSQEFFLAVCKTDRGLDHDMAHQVSSRGLPNRFDALAPQAKYLATLCFWWDLDFRFAFKRWDVNFPAQCRHRKADRHFAVQVSPVSLKYAMRLELHDDIQVSGWPTIHARLTLAGQPNAVAIVDTSGNLDRQRLVILDAARTAASLAGFWDYLSISVTSRAGLLD